MSEKRERNYSLDIIRIVATFFVVAVHFFLHTGFYAQPVEGKRMFLMVCVRTLFMSCVPLFMLLTGYLMNKKKLSMKYYFGITKVISIYILATLGCMIFKDAYLGQELTLKTFLTSLVNFNGANYSWYIQMYIGLFIVIPFLNLIYNGIETKKQKLISLIGLIAFVSLPPLVEKIFRTVEFLPTIALPNWSRLYPIMYYYIGAYISEFKPKIKMGVNVLLVFLTTFIIGTFYFVINRGNAFAWGDYQDSCSLLIVIVSTLIFVLLHNIDLAKAKDNTKRVLKHVSDITLGAYLMSYVFDEMIYTHLRNVVPDMLNRIYYFPITTILVFAGALLASEILNLLYKALCVIVYKAKNIITKCG